MAQGGKNSAELPISPRPLVIMSANSCWNIVNFRAHLVRDLIRRRYRVIVIAPADERQAAVTALGAEFRSISLNSAGLSVIEDVRSVLAYDRLFRELRPDFFLGFTAKPNIYGSIAAQRHGIRVVNNISGLGTAFIRRGPLQLLVAGLYRAALRRSSTVFFQNPDDRALFVGRRLVREEQAGLLAGSGIDLDHFAPRPLPPADDRPLRFLLVARMLRDKGVVEYVDAARLLRAQGKAVHFALLGPGDADNRTAISLEELAAWQAEGVVDYLGADDDVRSHIAAADCVVLPSYREGLPRSLIEAAAMARPVITTDVPGCR
ncbi:MAG: glycosyltransferase family 4 protein [Sphingomonas bacterium]|nr:glycosyltransferase family 4 protein [Sphingomonas bacterium]